VLALITRRKLLTTSIACAVSGASRAAAPSPHQLAFSIWREDQNIGRHTVTFSGGDPPGQIDIDAVMTIRLGPVPLFQYHHQATEIWRDGAFVALTSHTVTNGRREQLSATRLPEGVMVKTLRGARNLPADTAPLTHWNRAVLGGRLFNPETGVAMRESVARGPEQIRASSGRLILSTAYRLSGDADVTDWYDADGVWVALRAKVQDGSSIDYRRAT